MRSFCFKGSDGTDGQGPLNDLLKVFFAQGLKHINRGTRQQGRVHFKGRVLGGCANEGKQATLDMRQESILLAFVKPVHLVHKNDGALRLQTLQCGLCFFNRLPNVFDTTQHSTDADELRIKGIGHKSGNGGFSHTWWTPQNTTVRLSRFKGQTQRQSLAQQMLLPDDLTQTSGS